MKTIEFVVLAAFILFWFIFFLVLCYYASKNRRTEHVRRDHWHPTENENKAHPQTQYVGAIGWFQRYKRQNESKHELELL